MSIVARSLPVLRRSILYTYTTAEGQDKYSESHIRGIKLVFSSAIRFGEIARNYRSNKGEIIINAKI